MSEYVDVKEVAAIAVATRLLIRQITQELQIECQVSDKIVAELSKYFLRDINRLRERQSNRISCVKFAGYWAFWIRKLKPISLAFHVGSEKTTKDEVTHINELVALEVSISYILKVGNLSHTETISDPIRGACRLRLAGNCDGISCVRQSAYDYVRFDDAANLKYLVYSMRHRTFGPHHFVTNLDHMVFGACRAKGGI